MLTPLGLFNLLILRLGLRFNESRFVRVWRDNITVLLLIAEKKEGKRVGDACRSR